MVQVTLVREPSHSSPDLNKYVKDVVLFFDILDSEDNNNENKTLLVRFSSKCCKTNDTEASSTRFLYFF